MFLIFHGWVVDTEIDWKAYMQEVTGFLDGERNYYNLKVKRQHNRLLNTFTYVTGFTGRHRPARLPCGICVHFCRFEILNAVRSSRKSSRPTLQEIYGLRKDAHRTSFKVDVVYAVTSSPVSLDRLPKAFSPDFTFCKLL